MQDSKKKDSPKKNTDMKQFIKSWLKKTGYPFEMLVAQSLQKSGFSVSHSDYFKDSDTEKWRETDVTAYESYNIGENQFIFSLIAECKGNPSKPWVMFSTKDNYPKQLSMIRRATSKEGISLLSVLAHEKNVLESPLFYTAHRPGYNLKVSNTNCDDDSNNNRDYAYIALDSVLKATTGLVDRIESIQVKNIIPFVWPVIVINAPLFESYLDDKGNLQVNEIKKGQLIWKKPLIANQTFVDIYTKDAFIAEGKIIHKNATNFLEIAANKYHELNPKSERGYLSGIFNKENGNT